MSEILGEAVLDLDANLAPLDASLDKAEARVAQKVATMQAMLDSLHAPEIGGVRGGGGAALPGGGSRSLVQSNPGSSGLWGVRGPDAPGSRQNPIVMVLEASKYTPLGSMAAAVGESDMGDETRTSGNALTDASALDGIRSQLTQIAQGLSPAARLANEGQSGIATPSLPPASSSTSSPTDPAMLTAMQSAADALSKIHGDMTTQERTFVSTPQRSQTQSTSRGMPVASTAHSNATRPQTSQTTVIDSSHTVIEDRGGSGTAAYGATGAAGSSGKSGGGGPGVAAGSGGSGGGGKRVDIYYHRDPNGGGGGGSGGGGGGGGSRFQWSPLGGSRSNPDSATSGPLSLGNIFKGDEGRGGAFGLPGFGSVGSLAGLGLEHWLLSGLGVAASATSAVGGAGLLGAAGLSSMAVGSGADALVNKDTLSQAKALNPAVEALQKAVSQYGAASSQAATAQAALNSQIKALGQPAGEAEAQLDKNADAVKALFQTESTGARAEAANVMDQVVQLGATYTPLVVAAAQKNLGIINSGLKPLFQWLEGPEGVQIFETLENAFSRDLPTSIHAFDMGVEDFLRLMAVASQYTGGLAKDLDNIFTDKSRESTSQYDAEVQKLVGDLHEWEMLLKLLAEDMGGIFKEDAGTANSIVQELTQMLARLHEWEQTSSAQSSLKSIFAVHKQEILALLNLLPDLLKGYGQFYLDVAPPLVKALTNIAGAVNTIATAIEKIPGGADLLGLSLVFGKLGILGPGLRATASALGLMTAAEAKNAPVAGRDAAANAGLDASGVGGVGAAKGEAGTVEKEVSSGALGGRLSTVATGLGAIAAKITPLLAVISTFEGVGGIKPGFTGKQGGGLAKVLGPVSTSPTGDTGAAGAVEGFINKATFGLPDKTINALGLGNNTAEALQKLQKQLESFSSVSQMSTKQLGMFTTEVARISGMPDLTKKQRAGLLELLKELNSAGDATRQWNSVWNKGFDTADSAVTKFYRDTGRTLGDLKDDFNSNMKLIASTVGIQSGAGQKLMAQNVNKMVSSVTTGMLNGKIGVQHGMQAINNALQQGMQDGAISWTQDWQSMFKTVTDLYSKHKIDTQQYLTDVHGIMSQGDQHIKADTESNYKQMFAYLKGQYDDGNLTYQEFTHKVHEAQVTANAQAKTDMDGFAGKIISGFASATNQGGVGLKDMITNVNRALKLLGQAPLSALQVEVYTQGPGFNSNVTSPSGYGLPSGGASGMLMQVGQPGQAGRDSVPMSVGGQEIVVAPGEQVAVFNRHQLPIVNGALAPMGGLQGLFNNVKTPHYMASGGFVPDPGTNFTVNQEPQIADDLNALAQSLGVTIYGISGYRSPAHSVAVGGFADDPHTKGEAADIGVNSQSRPSAAQLSNAELAKFGLYRPFDPSDDPNNTEVNHVQLLAGAAQVAGAAAGASAASAAGAAVAAAVQHIAAPTVKGNGPLAKLVRAALGKTASAANSYLGKEAPSAAAGAGTGVSSAGIAPGSWLQVARQLASKFGWDASEIQAWQGVEAIEDGSYSLTAQNPTSPAYGLAQFIDGPSEYAQYGGNSTTLVGQLTAMANYIHQRYQTPSAALAHEHASGNYAKGGWVKTGATVDDFSGGPMQTDLPTSYNGGMTFAELLMTPPRHPNLGELLGLGAGTLPSAFPIDVMYNGRELDDIRRIDTGDGQPSTFYTVDLEKPAATRLGFPGMGDIQVRAHQALSAQQQAFVNAHKGKSSKKVGKPNTGKTLGATYTPSGTSGGILGENGPFPFITTDIDPIEQALQELLKLDGGDSSGVSAGTGGEASTMSNLIQWYTNLWGSGLYPDPNFSSWDSPSDFVISTDQYGNSISPYISGNINEVVQQLGQIMGYQSEWVGDLNSSLSLSQYLVKPIQKAIERRTAEVAKIKKRIEDNVKKIKALQAKIKAENNKKEPYPHAKTKAQDAANKTFQNTRKTNIAGWNKEITSLESENHQLGGSKTSVGTGEEIGAINAQLGVGATGGVLGTVLGSGGSASGLYALLSSVQGWESQLGGTGGDVATQNMQLQEYQQGLSGLLPGASIALTAAIDQGGSGASSQSSNLASLYQQLDTTLSEQYEVSQAQYAVLANLPPFGGSFATGGIVPGPVGAARTIVAHGGETVTPAGAGASWNHTVIVQDGAVDPNKIRVISRQEIQNASRKTGRRVSRGLPSRGGGALTPR